MTVKALSEEKMVGLVRNALLVAGHEMGTEGDHWPVINATIHSVMKDWEDLKIERNVHTELKTHLGEWVNELEAEVAKCDNEHRSQMEKGLLEIKEIYEAYCVSVSMDTLYIDEQNVPDHVKRVKAIVDTLEEENETNI